MEQRGNEITAEPTEPAEPVRPWQMIRQWLRAAPVQNKTLFGQVGRACVGHGDMAFVESLLSEHQEWKYVVELGTGSGLATVWLGTAMKLRDGVVYTWDQNRPKPFYLRHWPHGVVFRHGDIYEGPEVEIIREHVSRPNTIVICDGGDKTRELEMYAPYLADGNGIMCHDWASEVDHDRARVVVERHGLRPVLHDWAASCLARYRAWIK